MSANYVARQLDYKMTRGWGQGDKATNEYFRPLATFSQHFEEILQDIRAMGFSAIDLWLAHLNPAWATEEHKAIAGDLLAQYELPVVSLAGWFGSTAEAFEESCRLAVRLNRPVLGGSTAMLEKDRPFVIETLQKYGLKLGLENHPEKDPEEMLAKIGDGGAGTLGTTVDTGWYGTQGYDAAQAIEKSIQGCVNTIKRMGYQGPISVEHEPESFDPTEDCIANLAMLKAWLQSDQETAV
jgi:sugar phosphate isomerase/epimerase